MVDPVMGRHIEDELDGFQQLPDRLRVNLELIYQVETVDEGDESRMQTQ